MTSTRYDNLGKFLISWLQREFNYPKLSRFQILSGIKNVRDTHPLDPWESYQNMCAVFRLWLHSYVLLVDVLRTRTETVFLFMRNEHLKHLKNIKSQTLRHCADDNVWRPHSAYCISLRTCNTESEHKIEEWFALATNKWINITVIRVA